MNTTPSSQATVAQFCAAISAGQVETALSLLAPEVTWWVGGSVAELSGTRAGQAVRDMIVGVLDKTADAALVIESRAWTVDGDRVALEALVTANLRTGAAYRNEYHFLFVTTDGQIAGVRAYLDTELLRAVFGEPVTSSS